MQRARERRWRWLAALFVLAAGCAGTAASNDTGSPPEPAAATPTAGPADPVVAADERPNIVVFLTDDQSVEQMRVMDGTNRILGEGGVTFTQSFVNVPVCCPSRATLLTGQHATNHQVLSNRGVHGGFPAFDNQEATLATALQAGGYHTTFIGKYLNGFGYDDESRYTPPGWDDFRALMAPSEVLYLDSSFWVNGDIVHTGPDTYVTDVMTDHAIDAIDRAGDAPLFALVSYPAPHGQGGAPVEGFVAWEFFAEAEANPDPYLPPPLPAPRHVGRFADEPLPRPPSFNELDVNDKPPFLYRRIRQSDTIDAVESYYQAVLESLLAVDESILAISEQLEVAGNDRETWFVFTSDNGFLLGEHRHFGAKYFPYEEATRVPLLISGPEVRPGTSASSVVSNVDLAPTILDLAGARPDRPPDGRSLVGLLTGTEEPWGRAIFLEGYEFRPAAPPYKGVHTGDSVYIEWADGERELYDLRTDPYQLQNLAGSPDAADLQARNAAFLDELRSCAGPSCRLVGSNLDPPGDPAGQ